jgi:hypothetical protein
MFGRPVRRPGLPVGVSIHHVQIMLAKGWLSIRGGAQVRAARKWSEGKVLPWFEPCQKSGQEWAESGQEMSRSFGRGKTIVRVSSDRIPAVSAVLATPSGEAEHANRRAKTPQKRQKAALFDVVTRLHGPIRRLANGGQGAGEMPLEALFSDACRLRHGRTAWDCSHRTYNISAQLCASVVCSVWPLDGFSAVNRGAMTWGFAGPCNFAQLHLGCLAEGLPNGNHPARGETKRSFM